MGFIGPLIVWLIQKDKMKFVDDQGKEALNFQFNILGAEVALGLLGFLTCGFGLVVAVPVAIGLAVYAIVMPIIGAVKANAGEAYRYPYVIRMIT